MTQVWVIDLVIQTNQYNTGLEFLRELMFIYLNNAVRKLRYFVAIISQFMFYMMLQLSLKLSPSEQKKMFRWAPLFSFWKTYNRKIQIFDIWKRHKNEKNICGLDLSSQLQIFAVLAFRSNKLNKIDTKCSKF